MIRVMIRVRVRVQDWGKGQGYLKFEELLDDGNGLCVDGAAQHRRAWGPIRFESRTQTQNSKQKKKLTTRTQTNIRIHQTA